VQAGRQIRFAGTGEIRQLESALNTYVREAVAVEKAGLKVPLKRTADYEIPVEFQNELDKSQTLKKAFAALTPGRQRAYLLYFSSPKQTKTRSSRVAQYLQKILNGKGLDDLDT
jgi:uncharacterized protein YdeI (YjbR/CyaY-like superfamily)